MNVRLRTAYDGKERGNIVNVRDGTARALFNRRIADPLTETEQKRMAGLEKARNHKMVNREKKGVQVK